MLSKSSPQKALINRVSTKLHSDQYFEAAKEYAEYVRVATGKAVPVETREQATTMLTTLLHWCLENDGYEEAAQLCWSPSLFDFRPRSVKEVWKGWEESNLLLLMGAGSMSKSYSMGARLLLEWVRDPEHTHVKLGGPSEAHLKENLFNHIVTLHRQSAIPLPGKTQDLFIGLDSKSRKGAISGLVIPLGQTGSGRLQGVKRVKRKKPHPVFGPQTRMFVFLDEMVNIPPGIWRDIDNVLTAMDDSGTLKIAGAFNPTDFTCEVAKRCEPVDGWNSFDPDAHYDWTSKRGWRVIRLDATRCENVIEKKIIFPGLQTYEGLQAVIANSGGTDSPGYWAMGRGCFPPSGTSLSIIPQGMLVNFKAEVLWYEEPMPVGGVDLALEGGDTAEFYKGRFGLATGVMFPPSLQHPNGLTVMFTDHQKRKRPRMVLQADISLSLPRGDTVATKNEVRRIAQSFGIRPEHLCVDRTGNGQGVYDLLRFEWGEVIGVNYSEGASETRIMVEDHDIPKELYARVDSELWFAMRKFLEFGYVYGAAGLSTEDLFAQLTGRQFRMQGKRARVESKSDFKARHGGKSPDKADGFALLIMAVRRAFGFIPGMSPENSVENPMHDDRDDGGVRISEENRTEDLEYGM